MRNQDGLLLVSGFRVCPSAPWQDSLSYTKDGQRSGVYVRGTARRLALTVFKHRSCADVDDERVERSGSEWCSRTEGRWWCRAWSKGSQWWSLLLLGK